MQAKAKLITILIVGIFLASAISGCSDKGILNGGDGKTPEENHLPGVEKGKTALDSPATKTDIITLEGDEYSFEFTRFQADNIGFITYIPEDLLAEAEGSPAGERVFICANFSDKKRPDTYLSFHLYPKEVTIPDAATETQAYFEQRGYEFRQWEAAEFHLHPWAQEEFLLANYEGEPRYVGYVAFGRKDGQVLRVLRHMPEEFCEGFYPRSEKVLQDIEWYR